MFKLIARISKFFAALLIIFKVPKKLILIWISVKLFSDLYPAKF